MRIYHVNNYLVPSYHVPGHDALTKGQVLDSLKTLFPNISAREVKALVGSGNLSVDKLRHLLLNPNAPLVRDSSQIEQWPVRICHIAVNV